MFSEPWLAPLVAAFAGGALAGFSITLAWLSAYRRSTDHQREKRRLHARWLAGRVVLSRASISLVAAMRALRTNGETSGLQDLRMAETQRCRSAWSAARRELDRASAAMQAWYAAEGERIVLELNDRCAALVRQAIDGGEPEAAQLVQTMRDLDAAGEDMVRRALAPREALLWTVVRKIWRQCAATVTSIVRGWSAPP